MSDEAVGDPVTAYARAVIGNEIVAGRLVRLACERHLRDREHGPARGLTFDPKAAKRIIKFYGYLVHSKGEWAGDSLVLAPWEAFVVGSLMGWKRPDGTRRFRLAYIEVARKNGKSTIAAGLGLYLLVADKEAGAEVYVAATKREQAKIVWDEAARMRDKSPALKARIGKFVNNLHVLETASKMEPLGADADTLDGLNPSAVIIDELHAHKSRMVVDVMETALGARRQPLQFEITTAGYDRQSVCWERREYVRKVLERGLDDDTVFGYIATIDADDQWTDERCWAKANPNLAITPKIDYLRAKVAKAIKVPGAQNSFKRLHLNIWTEAEQTWLTSEAWQSVQAELDIEDYKGRKCHGAVDLSSKRDLTALALVFDHDDGGRAAFVWFFAPGEGIVEREDRDGVPYRLWRDQEYIEATPGPVVDYSFVAAKIAELGEQCEIEGLACDRYKRDALQAELDELGCTVPLIDHPQGYAKAAGSDLWMPGSVEATEEAIIKGAIKVNQNPCLTWNAASVVMETDAQGNRKPSKRKATGRIDGIVCLIQAMGAATVNVVPEPKPQFQVMILSPGG
jgi:phage terminase large subunit-like protein